MSANLSQLSVPSNAQYGEHVWTQWYRTQASSERIGSITYIIGAVLNPETPYTVMIKQGNMPFASLEKAEGWLQSRIRSGSKLERC